MSNHRVSMACVLCGTVATLAGNAAAAANKLATVHSDSADLICPPPDQLTEMVVSVSDRAFDSSVLLKEPCVLR